MENDQDNKNVNGNENDNENEAKKNHVSAGNMMTGPATRTGGAQSAGSERTGIS